jgi:flagellar biosynthesis/type III secretory pathway protein FliH
LYEQGFARENMINLFQFIDWMLTLPSELEKEFWQEFREYEETIRMRYVTSVERIGIEKGIEQGVEQGIQQGIEQGIKQGLIKGISLGLKLKFGESGESLLPEIESIGDVDLLSTILDAIETGTTLEQLRQVYQPVSE